MDAGTAIGSVFAAFGLSGAAGLNAWLPLFASALLERLGVVDLAQPFDSLSSNVGLAVLAAFLSSTTSSTSPGASSIRRPARCSSPARQVSRPTSRRIVAVVLGALTAGSLHAGRATVRPASTATAAHLGNPVLLLGEDAASGLLTLAAFTLPVLALLLVVALAVGLVVGYRLLRPRNRRAGRG